MDECSQKLYEFHYKRSAVEGNNKDLMDIKELLHTVDKYLFIMFRNKEITLDQLKARVAEKY